ncbi:Similar to spop-b: Speckle-type POZ protein B (Xenopus laevis) [Cotesia congregata]|uniref:Similar to spop-b: Speckle-type POZ protein B (Xenopus laevis) n=1 Tax=Cotesia congregata TaxID=51543 RepID=A0A8J2H600_COTCN|nr:Similar to spop-b: Speckle-type POZ protein B (Xenopus laevis) [Cotesia congregata]
MAVKRSITDVSKHTCHFEWRISDISSYLENFHNDLYPDKQQELRSATFTSGSAVGDKWCLRMAINYALFDDDDVLIQLEPVGEFDFGVKIKLTLFILDNEYLKKPIFDRNTVFDIRDEFNYAVLMSKNELLQNKNKLMFNDTLIIGAELTLFDITSSWLNDAMSFGPKCRRITDDYKDFLKKEQDTDTDVIIKVDDKIFKAHRAILMARCPDLFKLFPTRKDGSQVEGRITIPDMDPGTFYTILQFIHTDEVKDLDDNAENLLNAANKLKLKKLRQMCLQSLLKSLTCQSAPRLLKFAYDYNLSEILDFIANYIVSNADEVIDTPEYKTFTELNPSISYILFEKFITFKVDGSAFKNDTAS